MKKRALGLLLLLIASISVCPSVATNSDDVFMVQSIDSIDEDQSDIVFQEWGYVDFSPEGYIWSQVYMQGNTISLDGLKVSSLVTTQVRAIFDWAGVSVYQTDNPKDMNFHTTIRFRTNQPDVAENLADIIVAILGTKINMFDLQFEGSKGYDENYGSGFTAYTDVYYSAHVDFINMNHLIDNSVPRDLGGLAASIDVKPATNLEFDFWYGGDSNFGASIGVGYSSFVSTLSGGHSYDFEEILHVTNFNVADYADKFNLYARLPSVTDLSLSISNNSNTFINIRTFVPKEPQQDYSTTHIDIQLQGDASYDSISLTFNYEFTLWEWRNQDSLWWNVDRRGYSNINIDVQGKERAAPTRNLLANATIYGDAFSGWFYMDYQTTNIPGHHNFYLTLQFPTTVSFIDANTTMTTVAAEFEMLGIEFSVHWDSDLSVHDNYFWYQRNQTDILGEEITFAGYLSSRTQFESFIQNSYVYSKSAIMGATDISAIDIFTWNLYDVFVGRAATTGISVQPLDQGNANPTNYYNRDVEGLTTFNLLQPVGLGWDGTIPWNSYSEILQLHLNTPFVGDFKDLVFQPNTNNGYAWDSGRNLNNFNGAQSISYDIRIYAANPQIQDQTGTNAGPLQDISLKASTYFYGDNVDLEAPYTGNMWYRNPTGSNNQLEGYTNYSPLDHFVQLSDTEPLALEVYDSSPNYWNGTDYVPRFPSSGIKSVTGYFYREDAPIDHPLFNIPLSFNQNTSWVYNSPNYQVWDANLDTMGLPDGLYDLNVQTKDNNGNFDKRGVSELYIDNYDDTYKPAEITWSGDSPQENDRVSNFATFEFTVVDDAGIYAVIAYNNLGGYVQDPVSTDSNSSGFFATYSFTVDILAQRLPEDYRLTVTIDVLDMEGHWSSIDVTVIVDNLVTGDAPVISLVSPTDGFSVDNRDTSTLLFVASIIDDVGIKSALLQIQGPIDMEFSMFLNDATGYYEFEADLSNWDLGQYTWNVKVTDQDENTHIVTASNSLSFEIVGDPVSLDTSTPTIKLISPNSGVSVTGIIAITIEATDDIGISQVVFTDSLGIEYLMVKGPSDQYTFDWDSYNVVDGSTSLSATTRDHNGNKAIVTFSLVADNGRTASAPQIGLPGFGIVVTLVALFIIIPVLKKKHFELKPF